MDHRRNVSAWLRASSLVALAAALSGTAIASAPRESLHPAISVMPLRGAVTSKPFAGVKANTGRVSLELKGGKYTLTLSDDFKTPDTPAPHWRIVDSAGNTYLLERLKTKGQDDHANRTITVPDHIHSIAKVQIWCAWAEVVLGEASFDSPQMIDVHSSHSINAGPHQSSGFMGARANTGHVTHEIRDGRSVLQLSDDFQTPDTPAPHWRIIDSQGRAYLLASLKSKGQGDKANRRIEVPAYIPDVAKVQVYCAWAEVVLGEAKFEMPVR